jgi:hypothetical protein
MQVFNKNELSTLAAPRQGPFVSIYMPTHRVTTEFRQDSLRLKNLLRQAENALTGSGMRSPESKALLEPAEKKLSEILFWRGQKNGLALFMAPEFYRHYPLPVDLPELMVVGERFHLKPLLNLLAGGEFYILALSQNQVRFLQASPFSVSEIEIEGLPASIEEALKYDDPEKQLQFHTGTQKVTGDRAAMFHGHGVGTDDTKSNLMRFFQQVDRSLHTVLRHEEAPLVVAGVDYLLPIFREASSYAHLLPKGVPGNPEVLSPEQLQQQAWPLVEPYLNQSRQEAGTKYRELGGSGKTSHELKEILSAAYNGRVEILFVAVGQQEWGVYNAQRNELQRLSEARPDTEDLLDAAALQTLLKGGTVFAVEPEAIPDGPNIAAIFRY